jgi:cell division protein FtsI (penicillin-binding protein 3)
MRKTLSSPTPAAPNRLRWVVMTIYFGLVVVLSRLFYWQIVKGASLQAAAASQYSTRTVQSAHRGRIFTSDNYTLVDNQEVYRLFAEPPLLTQDKLLIANTLAPILLAEDERYQESSDSAFRKSIELDLIATLSARLSKPDSKWTALKTKISANAKKQIEQLNLAGIGFDPYLIRFYPEASLSAHLTGFVGKDDEGNELGYFGIEGAMNKELAGQTLSQTYQTDGHGLQLFFAPKTSNQTTTGRDVVLTVRRDIQAMVERYLDEGMKKYGAKAGEVIVLEPSTGRILAMASSPHYDQTHFYESSADLYKNPSLVSTYEPGSTFKILTVAAGINENKIKPDTLCPVCDGPRQIGKYTLRTWNNQYNPNISMTDALAKSDNVAMIYIGELLGNAVFFDYLEKFGIGEKIHIDLQEDTETPFTKKKGEIDLATASFGQGVVTTSLQLVRAVAAIANGGVMMRPQIVEKVIDPISNQVIVSEPIVERRVVSAETASQVSQMMIAAAEHGEAQWIASRTYTVAGKTGTSQVASENGGYDAEKTIASFIGFAPAQEPKFVMLVKLVEPQSSIWAAETAAPLWYQISQQLFWLLGIPPDKNLAS